MTDKDKTIKELQEALDSLDITNKYRLNLIRAIEYLQKEPASEDLEEAIGEYCSNPENFITYIDVGFKQSPIKKDDIPLIIEAIKFGANWQQEQMMANAVDGAFIRRNRYTKKNVLNGLDVTCDAIQDFRDKDKIKVLFVKVD